jgi:tRNA(fMet)-specific endonuclease VapC
MKYLLDTDHCIALAKKSAALMGMLREHPPSRVRASSIIMGELHYGAAKSKYPDIAAANMRRMLKTLVVVPFDDAAAQFYGPIRAALEQHGSPIGPLDTVIAAHAASLGWTLITHNVREFKRVPNLIVEDWLAERGS